MKNLYRPKHPSRQAVSRKGKGRRRMTRLLLTLGVPLLFLAAAGLAGFAGGTFGSPWVKEQLRKTPGFRLDTLTVKGNRLLSEEEVAERTAVEAGESILNVDLEAVRARLLEHPLVREASVSRQLPSELLIEIEERTPAAVVMEVGERVVDREGFVVNVPAGDGPAGLPCFTGIGIENGRVTGEGMLDLDDGIALARAIGAVGFPPSDEIECIDLSRGNDAVLLPRGEGPLVHLGRGDTYERLGRWRMIREDMASRWEAMEYIDLRAEGQVVVKPRAVPREEAPGGEDG
jgi:cell division septal protein FtsQ